MASKTKPAIIQPINNNYNTQKLEYIILQQVKIALIMVQVAENQEWEYYCSDVPRTTPCTLS